MYYTSAGLLFGKAYLPLLSFVIPTSYPVNTLCKGGQIYFLYTAMLDFLIEETVTQGIVKAVLITNLQAFNINDVIGRIRIYFKISRH